MKEKIINFIKELIDRGFYKNVYILIHAVGGLVGAMVWLPTAYHFTNNHHIGMMLFVIFMIALSWEVYEYLSAGKKKIIKIYGSLKNFYYDAFGDIFVALVGAYIVYLF